MLQSIRDGAQGWLAWVIVIIICVPFALWGIQEFSYSSSKRVIAEVNGAELSERDFKQRVAQQKRQLQSMLKDQSIDLSFMNQQIRQSTLTQMIEEEVLVQSATNANMRIGDDLLSSRIHSIPAFQQDGKFSQERYEQVIRNQYSSTAAFEVEIRRSLLTEQVRDGVLRSALFTDYDQQQHTRLKDQQRSITYIIIPAKRFENSVTITDADITTYYNEHAAQYMTPAKVSVEYVELSQTGLITEQEIDEERLKKLYKERKTSFTKPVQWQARHILLKVARDATPDEVKAIETKAKDLIAKINAGESFAKLAKQYSDDGSKNKGGYLGWFGKKIMVKPFEDAVKTLQVGEISAPIKTKFGFHIIKLEDSKPETTQAFTEVRTQLKQDIQKERAESEFYEQAEQFANLAFEHPDSLEILTDTLSLQSKTSKLFDRTGGDAKDVVLSNRKFIKAAFSDTVLKEGFNSNVVEVGEHHIAVLRLRDHKAAKPKPQADVKDDIVAAIKLERTKVEAKTLGKDLLEQIKQTGNPEVVKTENLAWSPVHWVTRGDTTLKQPAIVRQIFKMGQPTTKGKALYQSVELGNGDYALVAMLAVKDGVISSETSAKDETPEKTRQAQQQAFGESEFDHFISELKVEAEIKDYSARLVNRDL